MKSEPIDRNYADLHRILMQALHQAQSGKGKERHADGENFLNQPICRIVRRKGHGFTQGQVWKKILEVDNLPTIDAKIREMLSIIVYAAADILILEEEQSKQWEFECSADEKADEIQQRINVRTLEG